MMNLINKLNFILSVGLTILQPCHAATEREGSIAGNSSDRIVNERLVAGFLGRTPIEWCVVYDDGFGVTQEQATEQVKLAFHKWQQYLIGKRINFFPLVLKEFPVLAFNHRMQKNCNEDTKITFYFGATTEKLKARKDRFNAPLSFSKVEDYDPSVGSGKAYIWVESGAKGEEGGKKPNWSYLPSLQAILMHEMGHLLGCEHINGTIMRRDLGDVIDAITNKVRPKADDNESAAIEVLLGNIDYSQELYFGPTSGIILYNKFPKTSDRDGLEGLQKIYAKTLTRSLDGEMVYQKFYQFQGIDKEERAYGSLFVDDKPEITKQDGTKPFNHDAIVRFDFVFDHPEKAKDISLLSPEFIFRRVFGGLELKLYSASVIRDGRIIGVMNDGKMHEASLPIKYYRNVGRFYAAADWDKTLVRLTRILENGKEEAFFTAPFDRQGFKEDGFYNLPGGLSLDQLLQRDP